ncbi:glucose 1-dehydrogenase [Flavisphingomonas formosensis]|uniref:glucose 1-dehydrogenase n=1 Tax=Flavisphingomonas formosensis TaxID=861534 RepID=UPI0012FADEFE|nr:glucose 1-dehydrogenase [Sphingomonas formosensis]
MTDRPSEAAQSGRLAGKTALVTGAASGLGLAIATRFVREGARVLLTDRDAAAVCDRADALGMPFAHHDVTLEADWTEAINAAEQAWGGLHILVNNAGICIPGTIEETDLAAWRRTHAVNLDAVYLGCHIALPLIARSTAAQGERGSILNISSISAMVAGANMASYNSSKAAVRHLSKSVALHCAKQGYAVTCNSLHPTFIDTPLIDGLAGGVEREAMLAKLARQVPVGRVGKPDDVAWAAVYLCSDEAQFVTGAELVIDGGMSAQ